MNRLNVGLIGFGTVGSGVIKFLHERRNYIKNKFNTEFSVKKVCDLYIKEQKSPLLRGIARTTNFHDVINDPEIDVVIELIGGMHPAYEIVLGALKNKKHVITANKELLANEGKKLFRAALRNNRDIYFETSVGAGIPLIKSITEGLAGNKFNGLYGIINGTSNFILSEMAKSNCSFKYALQEAQKRGFAESNPTLDINGMDPAHKLAILVFLAFGKFVPVKNIFVEGIENISHADIEHAQSLQLVIKLLAIAKRVHNELEVRVHPTLIPKDHPLASVGGVFNAIFLNADPLGDVLLYGQGAGQMAAASGVVSDLINLAARHNAGSPVRVADLSKEISAIKLRKMDEIETKFYIRFMAIDKPGVLSKISGILGKYGISIASVTQKMRKRSSAVPVIILTHHAREKMLRLALEKITKLSIIKDYPVAIRMEKL
ncbi:MAG TPA: homoserine dehydrogenase [Candidatus Omnitrophota bacterium]|nr:homoserine dehydrogenase [Candidatus Omnitrophota bacterium]HPD85232.1 homoserine dehydrogenase [Candidatus Omnitrophota bacterium]HRZ04267.1 homoserine dehydrogenase [Candidatus Omnitrophota bacterium]